MSNSTITQLPQAQSVAGPEYLEAVQAGVSVRVTATQIAQLGLNNNVPIPVGSLPNPSTRAGARAFVLDAVSPTFSIIVVGGGSNIVPVYCDGINWHVG
jgi:hypothetical protein